MTGSGSAYFGLFINERCSKAALISLRKKYPKFWFQLQKLFKFIYDISVVVVGA